MADSDAELDKSSR